MKKTKLLIAMAAASMVAIATGTVSTMAWFKVDGVTAGLTSQAATGQLAVADNSVSTGAVTVTVSWGVMPTNVNYTDETGASYYYNGKVDADHKTSVANPVVTGEAPFTLSLVGSAADKIAASGTYTITFTAGGEVKIGNDVATAKAVTTAASTATHQFIIGVDGSITSGDSGSVIFGFMGTDSQQSGSIQNTITATAIAKNSQNVQ